MVCTGATVIDCDKLAHNIYAKGTRCFENVVKEFGDNIIHPESGEIDRTILGPMVFSDSKVRKILWPLRKHNAFLKFKKLQRLNEIVWPALFERIETVIKSPDTSPVVVLDAAVLIEARWHLKCDEVTFF